jgi:8-oxo-dGTP diphosphatase
MSKLFTKHRLARTLHRYPWLTTQLVRTYRIRLPRYTVGVVGLLLDDEQRVLLVEHVFHPIHPWGPPGGWVDRGEQPEDAVEREFREETTLEVKVVRPILAEQGHFWRDHLDVAYLVKAQGPININLCWELTEYNWFSLDELPPVGGFHALALARLKKELADSTLWAEEGDHTA